jgi:hypothetical protein
MSAPAFSIDAPRRTFLPALPRAWFAAAGLVLLALAIRFAFGTVADVAWMIDCNERWLAGAIPYRDFLEINPPASLMLYWPAVAAARAVGAPSEWGVLLFGFAASAAAIGVAGLVLRRTPPLPASIPLAAIVALLVLPGESFCERDHLAAVFGLPFLAVALARAERTELALWAALLAGFGAGAMAAIKPPYALIGVGVALYLARRVGWRAVLRAPEYYAATAIGLIYVASIGHFFPAYVKDVLPLGVDVYVPLRESLAALAASPGALIVLFIVATAALTAGDRIGSPGLTISMIATLGAGLAYFIQGKGWVYQAVPAMMFATIAGGFALGEREARPVGAIAASAAAAGIAVPLVHSLGLALFAGIAVGFAVETVRARKASLDLPGLWPLALAASIGAACGLCVIERPLTPALEKQLAELGPHLKLGAISEDMGLGFPLARRIGATWAMRTNSLFVNAGVERLLAEHPRDAGLAARVRPYAERETNELLADIATHRPDALLVGPVKTQLHADLFADPRIQAAMSDYQRIGAEQRPGYSAELWVRRDFSRAN